MVDGQQANIPCSGCPSHNGCLDKSIHYKESQTMDLNEKSVVKIDGDGTVVKCAKSLAGSECGYQPDTKVCGKCGAMAVEIKMVPVDEEDEEESTDEEDLLEETEEEAPMENGKPMLKTKGAGTWQTPKATRRAYSASMQDGLYRPAKGDAMMPEDEEDEEMYMDDEEDEEMYMDDEEDMGMEDEAKGYGDGRGRGYRGQGGYEYLGRVDMPRGPRRPGPVPGPRFSPGGGPVVGGPYRGPVGGTGRPQPGGPRGTGGPGRPTPHGTWGKGDEMMDEEYEMYMDDEENMGMEDEGKAGDGTWGGPMTVRQRAGELGGNQFQRRRPHQTPAIIVGRALRNQYGNPDGTWGKGDEMMDEEEEMYMDDEMMEEEDDMEAAPDLEAMRMARLRKLGTKSADVGMNGYMCAIDRKVYPGAASVCDDCPGGCMAEKGMPGLLHVEGLVEVMFKGDVIDSGYSQDADMYVVDVETKSGSINEVFVDGTSAEVLGFHRLDDSVLSQKSIMDDIQLVDFNEAADIAVKSIPGNVIAVEPAVFEGFDSYQVEIDGVDGKSYDVFVALDGETLGYDSYNSDETAEIEAEAAEIALKRAFSEDKRQEMAKEGTAMSDGSFPIASENDLRNAIMAHGRAKDIDAAKAHIKSRAAALGLEAMLPEDWKASEKSNPAEEFIQSLVEFEMLTAEVENPSTTK